MRVLIAAAGEITIRTNNRRTHPIVIKKYRALLRGIFQNYVNEMRLHAYSDVEHAFLEL